MLGSWMSHNLEQSDERVGWLTLCTTVHACDVTRDRSFLLFLRCICISNTKQCKENTLELTEPLRIKEAFPNRASEQYHHFRRAAQLSTSTSREHYLSASNISLSWLRIKSILSPFICWSVIYTGQPPSLCIIHSVPPFRLSVMHLSLELIIVADMCKYIFFIGRRKTWKLLKPQLTSSSGYSNKTGKVRWLQRNNEVRPCNHCCRRRAISIIYSECVSVAFGIQHSIR